MKLKVLIHMFRDKSIAVEVLLNLLNNQILWYKITKELYRINCRLMKIQFVTQAIGAPSQSSTKMSKSLKKRAKIKTNF